MTEDELEAELARPTPDLVAALAGIAGDILVLGVSGKMGPSLARLALEASAAGRMRRRVVGVARFSQPGVREALDHHGVETIACDLLDRKAMDALPDAPNVVYMAGRKFGTRMDQAATWATNAYLAGVVAERFRSARIVAFSTGNVYPLTPVDQNGPSEADPVGPVGEYAEAALGRERILQFFANRNRTPMAILRLNYAVEPRYGVVRDIADQVMAEAPIDLTMGYANLIWQRDANAIALRALALCATPPLVLNVTGRPAASIRDVAIRLGELLAIEPQLRGVEAANALLSDASQCDALFGPAPTSLDEMIRRVAEWVLTGGRSLQRPTHFAERGGHF
jgi:nucleoside-diphosphate-sugar epimerase